MKKLSQRLKDGRHEVKEKFPRLSRAGSTVNGGSVRTASKTNLNGGGGAADASDAAPRPSISQTLDVAAKEDGASEAEGPDNFRAEEPAAPLPEQAPGNNNNNNNNNNNAATENNGETNGDDLDLTPRTARPGELFILERKSLFLFSKAHLRIIMADFKLLRRFAEFLAESQPEGLALLTYFIACRKALAAIDYSNTVISGLSAGKSTVNGGSGNTTPPDTANEGLRRSADESFQQLAVEYLPMWVTNVWVKAVEVAIKMRVTGNLPSHLRDISEGLAETFCISDPSRPDNPMLFISEGFIKLTQYPNNFTIGQNCRLLRGPRTNSSGTRRLSRKIGDSQEHHEAVLNYRRDGTPFMNLLMVTPLFDGSGKTRYFLGSQIDVSGLLDDFYGFEHLHAFFEREGYAVKDEQDDMASSAFDAGSADSNKNNHNNNNNNKSALLALSELLTPGELAVVQRHGARLHRPDMEDPGSPAQETDRPSRLLLSESTNEEQRQSRLVLAGSPTSEKSHFDLDDGDDNTKTTTTTTTNKHHHATTDAHAHANGHHDDGEDHHHINTENYDLATTTADDDQASLAGLSAAPSFEALEHGGRLGCGLYDHYLLVRPAPSLRILFASPSLRAPGIVQSPLMDRVGGSGRMRSRIEAALTRGRRVTARVRWLPPAGAGGEAPRNRWMHATPLLGRRNEVGVWMVVLVDEEEEGEEEGQGEREERQAGARGAGPLESGGREAWSRSRRVSQDSSSRPGTAYSVSVAGGARSVLRNSRDPASIILGLKSARHGGGEGSVAGTEAPANGDLEP